MIRRRSYLDSFQQTVALGLSWARGFSHELPDALEVIRADMHTAACACGKMLIVERVNGHWLIDSSVRHVGNDIVRGTPRTRRERSRR